MTAASTGAADGASAFTPAQCDALFAAVLVNDVIDPDAHLPAGAYAPPEPALLAASFGLSRRLWETGVDRRALCAIVNGLCLGAGLDAAQQLAFKHLRARCKQLRAAYAVCSAAHRYPTGFHLAVSAMGRLQDAFKNHRRRATIYHALTLRLLLTTLPYRLAGREVAAFTPTSAAAFAAYVAQEMRALRTTATRPAVTGHEFHAARKVVSRQTALYCALTVLDPGPDRAALFRCLGTLNGMMGRFHDELVAKRLAAMQDYRADRLALPPAIGTRLTDLLDWFAAD